MKLISRVLPLFLLVSLMSGCYKNPPEDHIDEMPVASNTNMIKKEDREPQNEMNMPGMGMPSQNPSMQ